MATKTDMERVGLFKEVGYHTIGDPYKEPGRAQPAQGMKGRQMLPGGEKSKSAQVHGYFSEFQRVFEKEAMNDPIKMRRQQRMKDAQRNVGKTWSPASFPKKPEGAGHFYGTFANKMDYLSPVARNRPAYTAPGKNVQTNPPKKGSGYGYLDITLGKFPEYKTSKYEVSRENEKKENDAHKAKIAGRGGAFKSTCHGQDSFDPNIYKPAPGVKSGTRPSPPERKITNPFRPSNPAKEDGGCKAGTFNPFPTYPSSPYNVKKYQRPVQVVNNSGKTFIPNSGSKPTPNGSVMHYNIETHINSANYQDITAVMAY